jgi:hypothetical protein
MSRANTGTRSRRYTAPTATFNSAILDTEIGRQRTNHSTLIVSKTVSASSVARRSRQVPCMVSLAPAQSAKSHDLPCTAIRKNSLIVNKPAAASASYPPALVALGPGVSAFDPSSGSLFVSGINPHSLILLTEEPRAGWGSEVNSSQGLGCDVRLSGNARVDPPKRLKWCGSSFACQATSFGLPQCNVHMVQGPCQCLPLS